MKDLLRDVKFSREDILTLQDPAHPEKWDISTFHYVQHEESKSDELQFYCVHNVCVRQTRPQSRSVFSHSTDEPGN